MRLMRDEKREAAKLKDEVAERTRASGIASARATREVTSELDRQGWSFTTVAQL